MSESRLAWIIHKLKVLCQQEFNDNFAATFVINNYYFLNMFHTYTNVTRSRTNDSVTSQEDTVECMVVIFIRKFWKHFQTYANQPDRRDQIASYPVKWIYRPGKVGLHLLTVKLGLIHNCVMRDKMWSFERAGEMKDERVKKKTARRGQIRKMSMTKDGY